MSSRRRKRNTKKGNFIKVENALHQSRKCKFKIENVIKVENAIYIFHTDRLWNFVFQMKIMFYMIEGKQRNFIFLMQINFVGIYLKTTTKFSHLAFSQGSCKSTHKLIIHFFLLNTSLNNRWVLSNTLTSITRMHSQSLNVLETD